MCGIFFSLCRARSASPDAGTAHLLRNRGPDHVGTHHVPLSADHDQLLYQATFVSTVLSLRGTTVIEQPLVDEPSGSVLCWNGEAWKLAGQPVSGSDSQLVFQTLLEACGTSSNGEGGLAQRQTVNVLSSIRGPYAFVFYDARNRYLYYGRDCLGRRSLLRKHGSDDEVLLSSVCDNSTGQGWAEIEADGIHVIDLSQLPDQGPLSSTHIPHCRQCLHADQLHFVGKSPSPEHVLSPLECSVSPDERRNTYIRLGCLSNPPDCRSIKSVP
jgi:hypothetical protein